jgi:RNA polymerase sigma factor for flagellar operon FliA
MLHSAIAEDTLTYTRVTVQLDAETIVKTHSKLVRRIAWHVHSRMSTAIELEDLMQIGLAALVESARTFEDRGIAFAPYATMRVRGAMIDELRRDAKICRSGMANRRKLAQTRTNLENKLHRVASDTEIAAELGMNGDEYHAFAASTRGPQLESMDEVYSDHDLWFADMADTAESQVEQKQMRALLTEKVAELPQREAQVLQLYFVEELNLDEIGEVLGVGAARVCQIKKRALDQLREKLTVADF